MTAAQCARSHTAGTMAMVRIALIIAAALAAWLVGDATNAPGLGLLAALVVIGAARRLPGDPLAPGEVGVEAWPLGALVPTSTQEPPPEVGQRDQSADPRLRAPGGSGPVTAEARQAQKASSSPMSSGKNAAETISPSRTP